VGWTKNEEKVGMKRKPGLGERRGTECRRLFCHTPSSEKGEGPLSQEKTEGRAVVSTHPYWRRRTAGREAWSFLA